MTLLNFLYLLTFHIFSMKLLIYLCFFSSTFHTFPNQVLILHISIFLLYFFTKSIHLFISNNIVMHASHFGGLSSTFVSIYKSIFTTNISRMGSFPTHFSAFGYVALLLYLLNPFILISYHLDFFLTFYSIRIFPVFYLILFLYDIP